MGYCEMCGYKSSGKTSFCVICGHKLFQSGLCQNDHNDTDNAYGSYDAYGYPVKRMSYSAVRPANAMVCSLASQNYGMNMVVGEMPVMIGRNASCCQLLFALTTAGVSWQHCSVSYDAVNDEFIVTDLSSSYGTYLPNGQRLAAYVPYHLKSGDSFYVGAPGNVIQLMKG